MKIYKLYTTGLSYKDIYYDKTPILDNIGKILWKNINEISSFHFKWNTEENDKPICDCPFIIGSIPVFSNSAYEIIKQFLLDKEVQIIPISINGLSYYIINITLLLNDILSEKYSKIERFSSGRIMNIDKYVFKYRREIPPFFRIKQLPTFTFANEDVATTIKDSQITGIELEECKVKKWIF